MKQYCPRTWHTSVLPGTVVAINQLSHAQQSKLQSTVVCGYEYGSVQQTKPNVCPCEECFVSDERIRIRLLVRRQLYGVVVKHGRSNVPGC
jgi:hypothetical protein